jgi:hypothetical protein
MPELDSLRTAPPARRQRPGSASEGPPGARRATATGHTDQRQRPRRADRSCTQPSSSVPPSSPVPRHCRSAARIHTDMWAGSRACLRFVLVRRVRAQTAAPHPSLVLADGMCQRQKPLTPGRSRPERIDGKAQHALWLSVPSGMRSEVSNRHAQHALRLFALPGLPTVGHSSTPRSELRCLIFVHQHDVSPLVAQQLVTTSGSRVWLRRRRSGMRDHSHHER